jgi:hypothetical protein
MTEPLTLRQSLWAKEKARLAAQPSEPEPEPEAPSASRPTIIDDAAEILAAIQDGEVVKAALLQAIVRLDAAAARIDGLSGPYERARDALCAFLAEQARLAADDRVKRLARRRALAADPEEAAP